MGASVSKLQVGNNIATYINLHSHSATIYSTISIREICILYIYFFSSFDVFHRTLLLLTKIYIPFLSIKATLYDCAAKYCISYKIGRFPIVFLPNMLLSRCRSFHAVKRAGTFSVLEFSVYNIFLVNHYHRNIHFFFIHP